MIAKFLFGTYRISNIKTEEYKFGDLLLLTFKQDVFQHSDMKKYIEMTPSAGGFVSKLNKIENMRFYGESISCAVSTDSSMDEVYKDLTTTGSWWKTTIVVHGRYEYQVWGVCKKGYKPFLPYIDLEWKESSYEEMLKHMEEMDDKRY